MEVYKGKIGENVNEKIIFSLSAVIVWTWCLVAESGARENEMEETVPDEKEMIILDSQEHGVVDRRKANIF